MTSLADLIPDEWYMSVVCGCGERLILFQDLTEGKGSLEGAFEITCPACGERGCYPAQHFKYEPERTVTEQARCHAS